MTASKKGSSGPIVAVAVVLGAGVLVVSWALIVNWRSQGESSGEDAPVEIVRRSAEEFERGRWPKSYYDPSSEMTFVRRHETGELIADPATEAFRWESVLAPVLRAQVVKAVVTAASSPKAPDAGNHVMELVYRGKPVAGRDAAIRQARMVAGLPLELEFQRAFEMPQFYVFSYRGRYGTGDFSAGIAIRKSDGEVFRWKVEK